MSTPPTPRSSPPVQMPHVRRDYSIAFSEKFPGLGVSNNVTAIFMELTAAYNVQLTVSLATVAFGHGVEGLWLLPPAQAQAETETVAKITKSECLTNCFKAISKACPGKVLPKNEGKDFFHLDQFAMIITATMTLQLCCSILVCGANCPPTKSARSPLWDARAGQPECNSGPTDCLTSPPGGEVTGKVCLHMCTTSSTRAHTRCSNIESTEATIVPPKQI